MFYGYNILLKIAGRMFEMSCLKNPKKTCLSFQMTINRLVIQMLDKSISLYNHDIIHHPLKTSNQFLTQQPI